MECSSGDFIIWTTYKNSQYVKFSYFMRSSNFNIRIQAMIFKFWFSYSNQNHKKAAHYFFQLSGLSSVLLSETSLWHPPCPQTSNIQVTYKFSLIQLTVNFITHHVQGTLLPVWGVHLLIIRSSGSNGGFGSQSLNNKRNESFCPHLFVIIITYAYSYVFIHG